MSILSRTVSREVWSKSVALALLAIASHQKRDYALIHFSSPGETRKVVFSRGQSKSAELIEMIQFFYGGSTSYHEWMEWALELTAKSQFNKADVILISDGDVSIAATTIAEWNRIRKEREMRCFSLLISAAPDGSDTSSSNGDSYGREQLLKISDQVIDLLNFDEEEENDSFQSIFAI